jgi:enoyl-CoA hydratase/carnithine racemase/3-hydroxyacyl-CoA dehydrogenase
MTKSIRQSTLQTLGLGSVTDIFRQGKLPVNANNMVERVFGASGQRGSLVISGANGIVGAGKLMQLTARLEPFGVRSISLSRARTADGIGPQYAGLVQALGKERADRVMGNIVRMTYDGNSLPADLKQWNPRFVLEAIPEILDIKKAHYRVFQEAFPGIEIRSVTSGFPSSELGVGVLHPAFPHETNKVWEAVEDTPSDITQLLWALGLVPVPVSDDWSFVLDVMFCGLLVAGLRYHRATNMPYWKIDKYMRKFVGPNPFRAHDVIGAQGANFLSWSCLHHLSEKYGDLFRPTPELDERQESGQNWYPPNHFRPAVNWRMDDEQTNEFLTYIQGALFQMTSLMLHEQRGQLSHINAIGELCAQFRRGILAVIRGVGADVAIKRVEAFHQLCPAASKSCWYPAAFEQLDSPEWQQLYVNAEHDGTVGVITISRETYNYDVDAELNRAIDWLNAQDIPNVIVTGDFHLSTQMVGADTSEFFPALNNEEEGRRIAETWSKTARRLNNEFRVSVGFVNGKRCLGACLELLMHCHYLVAVEDAILGMPEVTLPIVPGMEACHWPFRKAEQSQWLKLVKLLLNGTPVKAKDAVGWLIDYAGPMQASLKMVWRLAATGGATGVPKRNLDGGVLPGIPTDTEVVASGNPVTEATRKAIMASIKASCGVPLSEALAIQAWHSAGFTITSYCKKGSIGADYTKTMLV